MNSKKIWQNIRFALFFVLFWIFTTIFVVIFSASYHHGSALDAKWAFVILLVPPVISYVLTRFMMRKEFAETRHATTEAARALADARERDAAAARWEEKQWLLEQIDRHRHALIRNVRLAVRKNDYGVVVSDNRQEAVKEFLESVKFSECYLTESDAIRLVLEDIAHGQTSSGDIAFDATTVPVDGLEFEHWVASALRTFGWKCEVTSGSGDQGIDVIARKGGIGIGIQCKLYSAPVGNRAVQEAISGAQFYGLHCAAVVTNASFTRSATDLATVTNVLLLSHFELPKLEVRAKEMLRLSFAVSPRNAAEE